MTMRPVVHLCALVLGAGAALATGCGGDRSGLLPADKAQSLKGDLQDVRQAVEDGDCGAAAAAIERARSAISNSGGLDPKLRGTLRGGLGRLSGTAATECTPDAPAQDTTTTEVPTTETTAPETTSTEETEPTTPAQTEETDPTDPTDPGTDPTDPSGGGVSPEDPGTTDPGTVVPDPGGADPTDPSGGDNGGFRGVGRDRGAAKGYSP